jgi:hypothetical protein
MENKMKNKIIKPMLIIASLTIGLGLTSCEKECLDDFKKEMSKCDSNSSDTLSNHTVKK